MAGRIDGGPLEDQMREYGFDESDLPPPGPEYRPGDGRPSLTPDAAAVARGSKAFLRDLAIIVAGFLGVALLLRLLIAALGG